jgi:hypothetical protein
MLRTSSRFDLKKKKKKSTENGHRSIYCGYQQNRAFQKGETREAQKRQEAARRRNKARMQRAKEN